MFGGKAREYPHLVSYLHYATQEQPFQWTTSPRLTFMGLGGLGILVGSLLVNQPILTVVAAGFTLPVVGMIAIGRRKTETPEDLRKREARDVARIMRHCLDLRRLHRDLDEASLTLIEECARYWGKIHSVFESGFWGQAGLAPAYQLARQNALRAADEGMEQVLLLYRPNLPANVQSRPAMDYVEEAVERFVFGGTAAGHLPSAFGPAREIAERLREVAAEAEQIAGDVNRERVAGESAMTGSLEATLGDLRAIRQAEDELRENLRG